MENKLTSRRDFLKASLTGVALVSSVSPLTAGIFTRQKEARKLHLYNTHTGEFFKEIFYEGGSYHREAVVTLNKFLRDHYTGEQTVMDLHLIEALHNLQNRLGCKKAIDVISAYRAPKTNARLRSKSKGVAKNSFHMRGKAIDIRTSECKIYELRDTVKSLKAGGVGCYPKSKMVHMDVGPVRYW